MDVDFTAMSDHVPQGLGEHASNGPNDEVNSDAQMVDSENFKSLQKPPTPNWMTDPHGWAKVVVKPNVGDELNDEVCVRVFYFTSSHMSIIATTNQSRSNKGLSQTAIVTEAQQGQIIQKQQATQTHQHHRPSQLSQQNATLPRRSSRAHQLVAAQAGSGVQLSQTTYVVVIQYKPLVESGGSEFMFSTQEPLGSDQFVTFSHYTKVFASFDDARTYAMQLFTERIAMDYRYVMAKAWKDLSVEEIQAYGIGEDGPSPHVPGFTMRIGEQNKPWQIHFGCEEEFCRIFIAESPSSHPKLEGYRLIGPGEPHGEIEGPISS